MLASLLLHSSGESLMCGIAGFLSPGGVDLQVGDATVSRMREALHHRGPDAGGNWLDFQEGIALGHQRLAIVDISEAGTQPMVSSSGRYALVFNGEVYNHSEIRAELPVQQWRGHSDTETLLAAIEIWGLIATLEKCVGMFAFGLWDRQKRELTLARDRMGEKPLYYGWQGKVFLFGSELKALRAHPDFKSDISAYSLSRYVRSGYISGEHSIFSGIRKLLPGHYLTLSASLGPKSEVSVSCYWDLADNIPLDSARYNKSPEQAVSDLESLILTSIDQQRIADVPLGAFLSGGIDSSTVVALMQSLSSNPVRTFSIGFDIDSYNEADYARQVAEHLGTDHTEFKVTSNDALEIIPNLPRIYDEPFADASQIPTTLVSRLAREHVTVALTGDGGDELFCGYGRYPHIEKTWGRLSKVPRVLRHVASSVLVSGAVKEALATDSLEEFYRFTNAQWKGFPLLVRNNMALSANVMVPEKLVSGCERLMYHDAMEYLPDDILTKVDRAAMSTSLETRVPLLDRRVVEFAWSLPNSIKYRFEDTKWPLKQILYKYVPEQLFDRPKMGFGVPIEHWLRGPLRDWAEDLLSEDRLEREGFFDVKTIRREWDVHLSKKQDRHYGLWTILMFQAWRQELSN